MLLSAPSPSPYTPPLPYHRPHLPAHPVMPCSALWTRLSALFATALHPPAAPADSDLVAAAPSSASAPRAVDRKFVPATIPSSASTHSSSPLAPPFPRDALLARPPPPCSRPHLHPPLRRTAAPPLPPLTLALPALPSTRASLLSADALANHRVCPLHISPTSSSSSTAVSTADNAPLLVPPSIPSTTCKKPPVPQPSRAVANAAVAAAVALANSVQADLHVQTVLVTRLLSALHDAQLQHEKLSATHLELQHDIQELRSSTAERLGMIAEDVALDRAVSTSQIARLSSENDDLRLENHTLKEEIETLHSSIEQMKETAAKEKRAMARELAHRVAATRAVEKGMDDARRTYVAAVTRMDAERETMLRQLRALSASSLSTGPSPPRVGRTPRTPPPGLVSGIPSPAQLRARVAIPPPSPGADGVSGDDRDGDSHDHDGDTDRGSISGGSERSSICDRCGPSRRCDVRRVGGGYHVEHMMDIIGNNMCCGGDERDRRLSTSSLSTDVTDFKSSSSPSPPSPSPASFANGMFDSPSPKLTPVGNSFYNSAPPSSTSILRKKTSNLSTGKLGLSKEMRWSSSTKRVGTSLKRFSDVSM